MAYPENFYCSDLAKEYDLPLMATATRGDVWFLLEYPYRWGHEAVKESDLPQAVLDHLAAAERLDLEVRTLLIRQGESLGRDGIQFFVAFTHPESLALYEYRLEGYQDLLHLDLPGMVACGAADPARLRTEPLYLVCANGKRDLCCARYGRGLYAAMQAADSENVWMSTHIGGHNKAPVNLFFPHGVHYGQIAPDQIGSVIRAYQQGEIVLDFYRGRVSLEPHLQAAEHLWRQQTGIFSLPGLRFGEVRQLEENRWQVEIFGIGSQASDVISIQQEFSDFAIPVSCSGDKRKPIPSFRRTE